MSYNTQEKLRQNLTAIRIALGFQKGDGLSEAQRWTLRSYSGFGGIKAILFPDRDKSSWQELKASQADLQLHAPVLELHTLLKEHLDKKQYQQAIDSLRASILTAFYTPEFLPQLIYKTLRGQAIAPRHLYEPSAGAGIFIQQALEGLPSLEQITAVEKDILSARILSAQLDRSIKPVTVHAMGLEETPLRENGKADLVISNIPFGKFRVFDPSIRNPELSGRIHNYFVAKGLDKLAEGGLMVYLTTDGFLNTPDNKAAREHLFAQADFISLAVMPDNLMKDTGNTDAPSHLLIVQKNTQKTGLSFDERLLIATLDQENEFGKYHQNSYLNLHGSRLLLGDSIQAGKNQYGSASLSVRQQGNLKALEPKLEAILAEGFAMNFNQQAFGRALSAPQTQQTQKQPLSFLPMPKQASARQGVQISLFDGTPFDTVARAAAYITTYDQALVHKDSARVLSIIKTAEHPDQECIVLLTARKKGKKNYYSYKLRSNVKEIRCAQHWMNATALKAELDQLSLNLTATGHTYRYFGDQTLRSNFGIQQPTPEDSREERPAETTSRLRPPQPKRPGSKKTAAGQSGLPSLFPQPPSQSPSQHKLPNEPQVKTPPGSPDPQNDQRAADYQSLRQAYLELTAEGPDDPQKRKALNLRYESFTSRHGQLHTARNRKLIAADTGLGEQLLSSLERKQGEVFIKADILTVPLSKDNGAFHTDNVLDALSHCLHQQGKVDPHYIAQLTGMSQQAVINGLEKRIYLNPESGEWETSDRYLSGNVVAKLRKAEQAAEKHPENLYYGQSLDAISQVQPEKIPFEILDFNLGERWIPASYYEQYCRELFQTNTQVHYFSALDTFRVIPATENAKITQEYAIKPKSGHPTKGHTLMEHALENTAPRYTFETTAADGSKHRVADTQAIQLAQQKIENIREGFVSWLKNLPAADKRNLEDLYNTRFNCNVLRKYDGSHLNFPGFDKAAIDGHELYATQKDATWRIIQENGALIDHNVGGGKTMIMITAAMELKRLGIAHKPMIIGKRSNIGQIARAFIKAYPGAKVLAPTAEDFEKKNRRRLFYEIANNNWDCVIISHEQFEKIPQSPEIQKEIIETELAHIRENLETAKSLGTEVRRLMLKGLEIKKKNREAQLKTIISELELRKDQGVNFRTMGIDHLFVDESHIFKNLTYNTRHVQVAGLGNHAGSQRALNMLFAVREIQSRYQADQGVTFLSGTPLSNSIAELYLQYKFLRPRELERQGLQNFDAWAAMFTKKTIEYEFSATNQLITKGRLRHFIKVPELALSYHELADFKTAEQIELDRPELDQRLVCLKQTPDQENYMQKLIEFGKTGNAELLGRGQLSRSEDKARSLIMANLARKATLDMRLIGPERYGDDPGNKVNACAENIAKIYRDTTEHRGVQLIFCDQSTPKPGFNVYDALRDKLVEKYGIPRSQIAFIHEWEGDRKKKELFDKVNSGEIRLLQGGSEKLGTGNNVQERVVALHHLDFSYTPKEIEQRNGRGARAGNLVARDFYGNKVLNFFYAVERSFDTFNFSLLHTKQSFIVQLKTCDKATRRLDEGSIDANGDTGFAEINAIISGDTSILERTRLHSRMVSMEGLRTSFYIELASSRRELEKSREQIPLTTRTLNELIADEKHLQSVMKYEKDGSLANPLFIPGCLSSDAELTGKYLLGLHQSPWHQPETKVGSLYGFGLFIQKSEQSKLISGKHISVPANLFYLQRPGGTIKYTFNNGYLNPEQPRQVAKYGLNALLKVEKLRESYQEQLKKLTINIPILETLVTKTFDQEAELLELKMQLKELDQQLQEKTEAAFLAGSGLLQEPGAVSVGTDGRLRGYTPGPGESRPPLIAGINLKIPAGFATGGLSFTVRERKTNRIRI